MSERKRELEQVNIAKRKNLYEQMGTITFQLINSNDNQLVNQHFVQKGWFVDIELLQVYIYVRYPFYKADGGL